MWGMTFKRSLAMFAAPAPEDIVDALEAEGSPLSLRAARYIKIKRHTEAGLQAQLRHMRESQEQQPEKP